MRNRRGSDEPERAAVEAWAHTTLALAVGAAKADGTPDYWVRLLAAVHSVDELAHRYGNRGLLRAMLTWAQASVDHATGGAKVPEGVDAMVQVRRGSNVAVELESPQEDEVAAAFAAGFIHAFLLGGEELARRHADSMPSNDPRLVADCLMNVLMMVARSKAEMPYGYATLGYEITERLAASD